MTVKKIIGPTAWADRVTLLANRTRARTGHAIGLSITHFISCVGSNSVQYSKIIISDDDNVNTFYSRRRYSRGRIAISRVCLCVSMCVCPRDRLTQKWMIQKCLNFVPGMTLGYPRNGMVLSQRSKVKVRVLARKVVLWIKVMVVWLRWDESILSGVVYCTWWKVYIPENRTSRNATWAAVGG